jgi:hypothetical protein
MQGHVTSFFTRSRTEKRYFSGLKEQLYFFDGMQGHVTSFFTRSRTEKRYFSGLKEQLYFHGGMQGHVTSFFTWSRTERNNFLTWRNRYLSVAIMYSQLGIQTRPQGVSVLHCRSGLSYIYCSPVITNYRPVMPSDQRLFVVLITVH